MPSDPPPNDEAASAETPRRRNLWVGLGAVVVVGGAIAWLAGLPRGLRDPNGKNEGPDVPVEKLIALKNRGVALLENEEWRAADAPLAELSEALPDDPVGIQNLVVARLLTLKETDRLRDPEGDAEAGRRATQALQRLRRVRPDHRATAVLGARTALAKGDKQGALERLQQATQRMPDDPVLWYELYELTRLPADNPEQAQVFEERQTEALKRAYALSPDNLVVAPAWLKVQASMQDPQIAATLAATRELVQPFVEMIKLRTRQDLNALFDDAEAAVEAKDWRAVRGAVGRVSNLLLPRDISGADRLRIHLHELAFVVQDFQTEVVEQRADAVTAKAPRFEFEPVPTGTVFPDDVSPKDARFADFDGNGTLDLVLLTDEGLTVLAQDTESGEWQQTAEIALGDEFTHLALYDFDSDSSINAEGRSHPADPDVVLWGPAGVLLVENRLDEGTGMRSLVVHEDSNLPRDGPVRSLVATDLESDGDLDLVFVTEAGPALWFNLGAFLFEDRSRHAVLPSPDEKVSLFFPVDWDEDVDVDLVGYSETENAFGLLENLRHGRFRWQMLRGTECPIDSVEEMQIADTDGDGIWEIIVGGEGLARLEPRGADDREDWQRQVISKKPLRGMQVEDFNNDGRLDVLVSDAAEGGILCFVGRGAGEFERIEPAGQSEPPRTLVFDAADFDADGDLDIVGAADDGPFALKNGTGGDRGWLSVQLEAAQVKGAAESEGGRVAEYGIGSVLEIMAGDDYQKRIVRRPFTHIGLGGREQADVLRILWPNGIPQNVLDVKADQRILERQILKGSCPYLYTFDGETFVFVTDLLWAAPIGLQFGEGQLAPSREWEYLKIRGDQLRPRDGRYELRITEELWEAGYFDSVRLFAVDHPADVDVFTNEKVGPPSIAEHKIHTLRNPRVPVSAVESSGRDILELLKESDDRYVRPFARKIRQGLTERHFVELDLGELEEPETIRLFLTGWTYPTDTSMNVGLSQHPDLSGPQPPELQVPDGEGGWRTALPYMGFPGGKTKTIVVTLPAEAFTNDDYRVRIVTSAEIYWDSMLFSVDEEPASVRVKELSLQSAELRFRGYSKRVEHPGFGPESYDYSDVSTEPRWPPMEGFFTRFGDVTPLLTEDDDRLVVLGAGDDLAIRFAAPGESPSEGWVRDFVIKSVGWDKDGDLNTVEGQAVEPLPFAGMSQYPYPVEESPKQRPKYRRYLEEWQTRTQPQKRFWRAMKNPDRSRRD